MAQEREPNNTVATADNIGAISRTGVREARTAKREGSVSFDDRDIFRFLTGNPATCEIKLSLSGVNGTVSLFRDSNRNGQLEASELIDSTLGKSSKTIVLEGAASELDEFYAQVSKGGPAANYSLDITVTPKVARESEPNNVASQAKDIGQLNGSRRYEGSVHNSKDRTDFYGFQIGATRNVSINLSDPNFSTANTDLRLYRDANNNKRIDSGEFVAASTGARSQENISRQLGAGNYFVEVVSLSGSVNYGLHMSAKS